MIHFPELKRIMDQQALLVYSVETNDPGELMMSYFRNIGICPNCLDMITTMWEDMAAEYADEDRSHAIGTSFQLGLAFGVLLGREHPVI